MPVLLVVPTSSANTKRGLTRLCDTRPGLNLLVPLHQPMNNTPVLLHDHDEHVPVDVYVNGIGTYVTLLGDLINTIKPSEKKADE